MENKQITKLLKKYRLGQCTDIESAMLESWYNKETSNNSKTLQIKEFQHQHDEIWENINKGLNIAPKKIVTPLWPRFVAAAIIILVGTAIFYLAPNIIVKNSQIVSNNNIDILPGKIGATLTLADGKKIKLDEAINGKIANESGISISKTASGQVVYELKSSASPPNKINTLSTENGETYALILPDNSKVWLNAASSLTYSTSLLEAGIRKVRLTGEAYFEISKDKEHSFIVETKGQRVEVFGTHFNINAYNDEPNITTTLLEGSVKVVAGKIEKILKPGFKSINTGDKLIIALANIETITDWKDGDFNLDGLNFKSAMRKIGRWYNIDVIYDASVPDNIVSGGWISRNTNLNTILEVVERSGQVHFKKDGRKLYVSK